jgi:hypothetical protein
LQLLQSLLHAGLIVFRFSCVRALEPHYSHLKAFKIMNTNVQEAEQRKQLQAIRAHLVSLEDGADQAIDV